MSVLFKTAEVRAVPQWWANGDPPPLAVNEAKAIRLAPVFAALRFLVDYVSTLPVDFYRLDGTKRIAVEPPELARNIDDEIGLGTFLGQAVYSIAAQGNAVGKITAFSPDKRPLMIMWSGMFSGGDNTPWILDGAPLPDGMIAHIPWIVPPGKRVGLSPIEHYAAIIRAGLSAQDYADVKRGGGLPPSVLKNTAKMIDAEVAATAAERASRSFANGKPFVVGSDWELHAMSIPPNHAQFIETLNLSANQIAAIYGIDPREIGGTPAQGSVAYTNDESRSLNRAQDAAPYVIRIERAMTRLLPDGVYMKLNVDARIRADIKTRTEIIGAQILDGRLSVNEARAYEDLAPVAGGDFHNVPAPNGEPVQR
jgi:hypothetical protein